jgi:hypothetical protein
MSDENPGIMLDEMESFPDRLARLIERLDNIHAAQRPSEKEWSAAEVVAHLRDVDEVYGARIVRIVGEDNPLFEDFDQEAAIEARRGQTEPLAAMFESFARGRAELVARLRGLDDEQWTRIGTHPIRGPGTILDYVRTLYHHDQAHAEQIREAGGLPL